MKLENSILNDIKESLNIPIDTEDFDSEIIMHVDGALAILNQNGVGNPVILTGVDETWNDFLSPIIPETLYHMVPLFVKLSVKLIFDPPPPSTVDVYKENISMLLWRLKTSYEYNQASN